MLIKKWTDRLLDKQPEDNTQGNTIYRLFADSERYIVDFAPDFKSEGWEQFDTDQDAPYFGAWVNKAKLLTLTYCEGDWSLVTCADWTCYLLEVESMCRFYDEGRIATVINDAGQVTLLKQDRASFLEPLS